MPLSMHAPRHARPWAHTSVAASCTCCTPGSTTQPRSLFVMAWREAGWPLPGPLVEIGCWLIMVLSCGMPLEAQVGGTRPAQWLCEESGKACKPCMSCVCVFVGPWEHVFVSLWAHGNIYCREQLMHHSASELAKGGQLRRALPLPCTSRRTRGALSIGPPMTLPMHYLCPFCSIPAPPYCLCPSPCSCPSALPLPL